MAVFKAFKAFRPSKENQSLIPALPYDVMNSQEARKMVQGKPLSFLHVDKAEIDVQGGVFRILRDGYSEECRYVQRVELNGKALERNYITHDEVVAGGELRFVMGKEQSCWY